MISQNMREWNFAGLSFDELMNLSGLAGVSLVLLAFWLVARGIVDPDEVFIRIFKYSGYVLIALPLFSSWYLSESLLFVIGISISSVSGVIMFLRRKGI